MSLELLVFDSKSCAKQIKYYNMLYDFFTDSWSSTFDDLGTSNVNFQTEFSRMQTKVGIFDEGRPIAFHGYNYFDLKFKSDGDHHYFKQFKEPVVDLLKERGIYKAVSMEYMFVDRKYRKISGQPMGEVLGGFSTQYFRGASVDAVLAVTRNDRGVDKMCEKYGAETLVNNVSLHGVDVNFMYFTPSKIKNNPSTVVQNIIDNFSFDTSNTIGIAA